MQAAQNGDVVYCDPPYVPLSSTANFTSYSEGGFSEAMQFALAEEARDLAKRGVPVLLSNHDTTETRKLYHGAQVRTIQAPRFISSKAATRGSVAEVLALFSPNLDTSRSTDDFAA
jgi:DNA adenine methylase